MVSGTNGATLIGEAGNDTLIGAGLDDVIDAGTEDDLVDVLDRAVPSTIASRVGSHQSS